METFEEFEKYFGYNSDFWRAFKKNNFIFKIPKTKATRLEILTKVYEAIASKRYFPLPPERFIDMDKGNCVTRMIPVFHLEDYIVYYYCIKKLEEKIAINRVPNTFGGWSLGGIMRTSENDEITKRKEDYDTYEDFLADLNGISVGSYSFNPQGWVKAYGELNAKLFATAKEQDFNILAEMDIANFYDSIRLDILENNIRAVSESKDIEIVNLLFMFLNNWNRENNEFNKQTVGLPQDAMSDCSRILANFYLQNYDRYAYDLCDEKDARYLRYADDQFIFAKDSKTVEYLIFKLSKKLTSFGLSINQKKVKIMRSKDVISYRSLDIFSILKDSEDKNDVAKVERFAKKTLELLSDTEKLRETRDCGYGLIKKLVNCNAFNEVDARTKSSILKIALDNKYLKRADSFFLDKLYKALPNRVKSSYINNLINLSENLLHNHFHYHLLAFLKENKMETGKVVSRIRRLSRI